jgi:hypothetical protein
VDRMRLPSRKTTVRTGRDASLTLTRALNGRRVQRVRPRTPLA